MKEPIFPLRSRSNATTSINDKTGLQSKDTELVLFQQLSRGLEHLERHLVLLPEPYPGCVLFFTVAAQDQLASVFYVRGTNLETAWREGSTRVRQWAWARKQSAVELRIDWVQDIVALKADDFLTHPLDPNKSWALADAELEQAELLLQHLPNSADKTSLHTRLQLHRDLLHGSFSLLLSLQGIYIQGKEVEIAVPRLAHRPWHLPSYLAAVSAPLRSTLNLLLHRQQADGSWPGVQQVSDHLGVTYTLLQIQLHLEHPGLPKAVHHAFAYFKSKQHLLPHDGAHQSLALLVMVRYAWHLRASRTTGAPHIGPSMRNDMERVAEDLLPAANTSQPSVMAWAGLALSAFAHGGIETSSSATLHQVQSTISTNSSPHPLLISLFLQRPQIPPPPNEPWLAIAVAESSLLNMDSVPDREAVQHHRLAGLQELLLSVCERMVLPEQALYLPPASREETAFFQNAGTRQPLTDTRISAHLLLTALAALELLRKWAAPPARELLMPQAREDWYMARDQDPAHRMLDMGDSLSPARPGAEINTRFEQHLHSAHISHPMQWDGATLARIMGGTWVNLQQPASPPNCTGLDINRQHHLPGAAVLVRRSGLSIGIPPAALQALQISALISNSPHGLFRHGAPILHVPDIHTGLWNLAKASRQRIKAPVIAATGCAGKTSTLSMLRRCLLGIDDVRGDALLAQGTSLQMINWSETLPCALIELPLSTLHRDLILTNPDVLIITNLEISKTREQKNTTEKQELILQKKHKSIAIEKIIYTLKNGSTLIMEHGFGSDPHLIQVAKNAGVQIITFGPYAEAQVRELAFHPGKLQVSIDKRTLEFKLQSSAHHMALNAQAALAVLRSLEKPVIEVRERLERWHPLPGTGQPQLLPNGICLLDHSQSSHMVSMQAAFAQLQAHASPSDSKIIVLAGIQTSASELESSQLQLEPLIRASQAKQVLLYGEPLHQLASALHDLPYVNWCDDLNQLLSCLLRTAHQGDTVLLAGRATTNLAIAADALRENS